MACKLAANHGHLECLRYLHENECPWPANICNDAANSGNLDCLKYTHENGGQIGPMTMSYAIGNIDCLRYLHGLGCPWGERSCTDAVLKSSFECLRFAHENGQPWDAITCFCAAQQNRLDFLRYLRENGCSWVMTFDRSANAPMTATQSVNPQNGSQRIVNPKIIMERDNSAEIELYVLFRVLDSRKQNAKLFEEINGRIDFRRKQRKVLEELGHVPENTNNGFPGGNLYRTGKKRFVKLKRMCSEALK